MLMVGDAGECDGSRLLLLTQGRLPVVGMNGGMAAMTPVEGMSYSIDGQMGYVEAYSSGMTYLKEDDDGEIW